MLNIKIIPVSKPRMTRADTWKKRPCVTRYWAYKDELNEKIKELDIKVQDELFLEFYMPMPKSWSKKKKLDLLNKPHQQKPDIDNLVKGVMDAIFKEDSHVHTIYAKKIWSNEASMTFISGKNLVGYLS
tara:strand:- start:1584 stop:1970 length:387 start_codon:yes stop_codon:yes gene_type:complete